MNSSLDKIETIKRIDGSGMHSILERLPEHCEFAIKVADGIRIPRSVRINEKLSLVYGEPGKIIVAGMGGSAIGGEVLKHWLRESLPIPIEVCRGYTLPAYADEETLVFVISYSGNTEETLSCFIEAIKRRCMVISISSNGVLQEFSERIGVPYVKLPSGFPPRSAIPYLFFPLAISLKKIGVLRGLDGEITEAIDVLKGLREKIKPEHHSSENPAKKIAMGIEGYIPLISTFGFYEAAAMRMKTQFNENSKTTAKIEIFPELNHNEVVGWTGLKKLTKNFCVILLRDVDEPREIKVRIEATKNLVFSEGAAKVLEIWSMGRGRLARIFSTIYIGDFASFYLAILYGFDPTPVRVIDELKKHLEERVGKVNELRKKLEALLSG